MRWLILFSVLALDLWRTAETAVCNEIVCVSVVSKCMLTQSCKCDLSHCSCCKDCVNCLSHLYDDCCACVDMCPGSSGTVNAGIDTTMIGRQSFLEDLPDSTPALFNALTAGPDHKNRWRIVSMPIKISDDSLQQVDDDDGERNVKKINCTVVYMSDCLSWKKCKNSCETMGASSLRWFRDGCCECIGESCKDYGIEQSKCLACGEGSMIEEDDISDDDLEYGEDADPQDTDS